MAVPANERKRVVAAAEGLESGQEGGSRCSAEDFEGRVVVWHGGADVDGGGEVEGERKTGGVVVEGIEFEEWCGA